MLPASAGMFPVRPHVEALETHAPRKRGDVPPIFSFRIDLPKCSPQARGCSQPILRFRHGGCMLPASAGMFPDLRRSCWVDLHAPRKRGDVP